MANNKKPVEDIFSETETKKPVNSGKSAAAARPKRDNVPSPAAAAGNQVIKSQSRIIVLFVFAVIVLAGLGWVVFSRGGLLNSENKNSKVAANANTASMITNINISPSANIAPADADKDGLSDEEEKALGVNPNNPDTDGDGLYDREEVKVYKTNPLVKDTDGDGVSDGDEVKNGTNPNGPGKLLDLPKAIENVNK